MIALDAAIITATGIGGAALGEALLNPKPRNWIVAIIGGIVVVLVFWLARRRDNANP